MQVDRERESYASDCRGHLGDILFEMEGRVANLVGWAHAIRDFGTCDGDVSAEGLFAIGGAMLDDAKAVRDDWKRCLELSRELQRVSR